MKDIVRRSRRSPLLLSLLALDIVFMLLHVVYMGADNLFDTTRFLNPNLSLTEEGGYAEIFQYLKEGFIALCFFVLLFRKRALAYLGWALFFTFLLLDDALQIHERLGGLWAARAATETLFGLRSQDLGELMVAGLAGLVFASLLVWGYLRAERQVRKVSRDTALMVIVLVFFGVFVDMLHMAFYTPLTNVLFGVIEDGGEMVVMSLIAWYVLGLVLRQPRTGANLVTR